MPTRASTSWFARSVSHWVGPRVLAALVLALCLGLTYGAWRNAHDASEQQVQADFDFRVRELVGNIVVRMQTYIQVLHGVQGLYASSQDVTRSEFHAYLAVQQVDRHFPGIHGVGYLPLLPGAGLARHEASVRAEGYPGYAVRPPGQRAWHAPITYLEPLSESNLLALGYDIWSEPVRRAALEQARDTGQAAMTGKIQLVQDGGSAQAHGFLIVLPVYDNGLPRASVAQRRAALRAWVFAPFRMVDLMAGVGGEGARQLDLEIYDGVKQAEAALMYDSLPDMQAAAGSDSMVSQQAVSVAGHAWTLRVRAMPGFDGELLARPRLVAWTGLLASIVLALAAWRPGCWRRAAPAPRRRWRVRAS